LTWRSATTTETVNSYEYSKHERDEAPADAPGEMLREDFLVDYGLTVSGLAEALGVSRQSVNELLRERRAVSPEAPRASCWRSLYWAK
jgi:antitoxin HigA-1